MLIVFEDNDKTPSSVLLRNSYYGDHICFTCGSTQLGIFIEQHIDNEDLIVFVDVVPNNVYTVKLYNDLVRKFKQYTAVGKLLIVPIICIEYTILAMLVNYKYLDADKSVYLQNLIVKFKSLIIMMKNFRRRLSVRIL